ncbi:zinc finger BED domain-containing protein DAYSLEEPER [Aspergillus awamori]|uniref:Zinc finger BED domain-containing protein DAYSLEEPER n=1 Tax=Aspergillus awamori TaxID=105351 RepID=A0A401L2Z3_ASPAW|nr:zinc finger BED domain-containing protein DAYSLEEPER [Aspergillus awamori]
MDSQDAYYIALVLDPRFKTLLLEKELGPTTAPTIIGSIKETLHEQYPSNPPPELSTSRSNVDNKRQSLEARVLQKLQPQVIQRSEIDRYFEEGVVTVDESITGNENWLFSWWNMHKDEYPRMAAAARDYLAIPAAEVAVERLFSRGATVGKHVQQAIKRATKVTIALNGLQQLRPEQMPLDARRPGLQENSNVAAVTFSSGLGNLDFVNLSMYP